MKELEHLLEVEAALVHGGSFEHFELLPDLSSMELNADSAPTYLVQGAVMVLHQFDKGSPSHTELVRMILNHGGGRRFHLVPEGDGVHAVCHVTFSLEEIDNKQVGFLGGIAGIEYLYDRGSFCHRYDFRIKRGLLFSWAQIEKEIECWIESL